MVTQLVVAAVAWGTPGAAPTYTSPGCPPLHVLGTVPSDGAVVPDDVVFRVVVEPAYEACYSPVLELFDDLGSPVAALVQPRGNGLWGLAPEEPLRLGGRYTFRVSDAAYGDPYGSGYGYGGEEVTVTVGEPGQVSTDAPTMTLDVQHQCESALVEPSVRLETSEPVSGLLSIEYDVDGTIFPVFVSIVEQTVLADRSSFRGGAVVCATVRFEDLSGVEAWSVERTCAPEYRCPTYDPPDSVGFSMEAVCASGEPSTRIVADIDLPPADPDARGTLGMEVTTDLGVQGFPWAVGMEGESGDQHVEVTVLGGHDVCFELVMFGSFGEELWRDGPYCSAAPVTCPAEGRDPSEPSGCGCDGSSGAGVASVPGLALALLASRRRRR